MDFVHDQSSPGALEGCTGPGDTKVGARDLKSRGILLLQCSKVLPVVRYGVLVLAH